MGDNCTGILVLGLGELLSTLYLAAKIFWEETKKKKREIRML